MRDLVDELAADLRPVRRRNVGVETLAIAALCAIELALWLMAGMARPDLIHVMETTPTFCWRISSAGVLAVIGAATPIAPLGPAANAPHSRLRLADGAPGADRPRRHRDGVRPPRRRLGGLRVHVPL